MNLKKDTIARMKCEYSGFVKGETVKVTYIPRSEVDRNTLIKVESLKNPMKKASLFAHRIEVL